MYTHSTPRHWAEWCDAHVAHCNRFAFSNIININVCSTTVCLRIYRFVYCANSLICYCGTVRIVRSLTRAGVRVCFSCAMRLYTRAPQSAADREQQLPAHTHTHTARTFYAYNTRASRARNNVRYLICIFGEFQRPQPPPPPPPSSSALSLPQHPHPSVFIYVLLLYMNGKRVAKCGAHDHREFVSYRIMLE